MLTLENYREFLITHTINGVTVRFLIANGQTVEAARPKVDTARSFLAAMPRQHLAAAFPIIFIPGRLPSTGDGGGTPGHPDILIQRRTTDIGVATDAMQDLLRSVNTGMRRSSFHWIPPHVYADDGRLPFTVAHEVMHGVDINLRLHVRRQITPELAESTGETQTPQRAFSSADLPSRLPGQACGSGVEPVRLSVNGYLSMITGFRGANSAAQTQIINSLRLSKAFEGVPETWWATYPPPEPRRRRRPAH